MQQPDIGGDGLGDACDPDDDGDGILDCGGDGICHPEDDDYNNDNDFETDEPGECAAEDECPDGSYDLVDNDGDGVVDEYSEDAFPCAVWPGRDMPPSLPEDNCRRIFNPDQTDTDGDGIGDACDEDDDGDGIGDALDGCPLTVDPEQPDLDGDGVNDACDPVDDRAFEVRSREERCAILMEQRAPTAERLQHCPRPADDGCTVSPPRTPAGERVTESGSGRPPEVSLRRRQLVAGARPSGGA